LVPPPRDVFLITGVLPPTAFFFNPFLDLSLFEVVNVRGLIMVNEIGFSHSGLKAVFRGDQKMFSLPRGQSSAWVGTRVFEKCSGRWAGRWVPHLRVFFVCYAVPPPVHFWYNLPPRGAVP